jgi:hypothetical protein
MTQATEQVDASVAPIANVTTQGQLGPNIVGSGTATFTSNGGTFYLFFAPSGASQVNYGVNGEFPSTPLPALVWTPIEGASSVNIRYAAAVGADMKLLWAQ